MKSTRGRPADRSWRARAQPARRQPRPAPGRPDRLHRACPAAASPASPSTRSSPRASAVTSSRCRPTPGSSSARWTSPTSTSSRACSPAVSIDQKSTSRNPRSTVGTITEVWDYLRLLYARIGTPHCPECGAPIARQTPQQIVDRVMELEEGTRFQVLAPVVRGRKGEYAELFRELQTQGLRPRPGRRHGDHAERATEAREVREARHRGGRSTGSSVKASAKRRLTDSVETALNLACGIVVLDFVDLPEDDPHRERKYSERLACPNDHPLTIEDLEPRTFSFNSPYGACPTCTGLGVQLEADEELIVPDPTKSLADGAVSVWFGQNGRDYFGRLVDALGEELGFDVTTPVGEAAREGAQGDAARLSEAGPRPLQEPLRPRAVVLDARFEGAIPHIERRHGEAESDTSRERFEGFMREVPCPACGGARLKPEVACGQPGWRSIAEVARLPIGDCAAWLGKHEADGARAADRPPGPQGDQRAAAVPRRRRAATTSHSTAPLRRLPAERRSGSGSPPRSDRASSACSTSSTSRRSACISATTGG